MTQDTRFGRRSFLRTAATVGVTAGIGKMEQPRETVYRLQTPECEVRMSVEYFGKSVKNFRFRDQLSDRAFCLSANGNENQSCVEEFTGSVAVAYYHFRPRSNSQLNLRERVLTIDHDNRMAPRPPFERTLPIQRDMASDIQAFGYTRDFSSHEQLVAPSPWRLLRQDLFLNDQAAAFVIVHWKHTIESITLVDVIPGDQTKIVG